jgi:hypothetical protein
MVLMHAFCSFIMDLLEQHANGMLLHDLDKKLKLFKNGLMDLLTTILYLLISLFVTTT